MSRYHELGCTGHASGSDGHLALANGGSDALDLLALNMTGTADADADTIGTTVIPAATIELAHALITGLGFHGDPPAVAAPELGWSDLLSQPRQLDARAAMGGRAGPGRSAAADAGHDTSLTASLRPVAAPYVAAAPGGAGPGSAAGRRAG